MRRLIAALSVLALLAVPVSAWDNKRMDVQINETNFSYSDMCSATVIDKDKKLLLTAAHCTVPHEMVIVEEGTPKEDPKKRIGYREMYVSHKYVNPNTGTEVYEKYIVVVKAVDKERDVAILEIKDKDIFLPLEARISEAPVYRGDKVYTVGNPRGLEATLSTGLVSNNYRILDGPSPWKFPLYQVDVAGAAPGSSGCAVYNEKEEIIGVLVGGLQPGLVVVVPVKHAVNLLGKTSN